MRAPRDGFGLSSLPTRCSFRTVRGVRLSLQVHAGRDRYHFDLDDQILQLLGSTNMSSYQFTLIVEGPDLQSDTVIGALFESGCDDALVGRTDGIQYLDFDREAPNPEAAILSAIAAVERLPDLEVIRLAGGGLVSMADIASHTGRTRESIRLLITGERGPGRFPAPVTDPRTRYRLWRWSEVRRWFEANYADRPVKRDDAAYDQVAAAINAGLELRHYCRYVQPEQRVRINQFIGL